MERIKTSSFDLACYINGNPNADKLLLCLPGFLDAGNYAHFQTHRAYFAERGFLCVSFDPPGTFLSPGEISLYTATNYLQTVQELIAYFGNRETILLGHSLGGTVALLAASESNAVTQTVSIFSIGDIKNDYSKNSRGARQEKGVRTGQRDIPDGGIREYCIPYSFVEDMLQHKIVFTQKKKLFIVGKHDELVSPELVKKGFAMASEPKQLVEIACHDHDYRKYPSVIDEVNRIIEKFLE